MKKFRKLLSLVLAMVMVLAMAAPSFAQTVSGTSADGASIVIKNASKGVRYSVYKLFDATVTGTEDGSIAYQGDVPVELEAYFTKDSAGNILPTEAAGTEGSMSDDLRTALGEWAEDQAAIVSDDADGSELTFNNLDYGYYVVTTTQGNQAITVTSTNPNAEIYDKNETEPTPDQGGLKTFEGSDEDDEDVYVGETVTYQIAFNTTNYIGSGEDAKKVLSYTITDSMPDFLDNVTITEIKIGDESYKVNDEVPNFDERGTITIPWVDNENGDSLYVNGAKIVITYTAIVTDSIAIDGDGNENTVTVNWTTEEGTDEEKLTGTETVYTYAIAIKKVDENGQNLAGAEFSVAGIKVKRESDGVYVVTEKGAELNTGALACDSNGELVIKGVDAGIYKVTEETAPNGYNKLTDPVSVEAVKTGETTTTTTKYIDEEGNISDIETEVAVTYTNKDLSASAAFVVNMTGTTLPSTGGIGTTIFYAAGILLMAGAVFFVVRRKRA